MLFTDPIFLLILFFGIWTSYTDIRFGKIKNITVLLIILSGIMVNIFFTKTFLNSPFKILINSALSLIIGFLLWNFDFLSAADAKLFFAFSLLIPLKTYEKGTILYFPSYIILVNSFVPIAIFFLLYSIIKMDLKHFKQEIKRMLTFRWILTMTIFMIGFSSISYFLNDTFNLKINYIFQIILMFIIFEIFNNFKRIFMYITFIIFSVLVLIISPETIFTLTFLKSVISGVLIFSTLRLLIKNLDDFSLTKNVRIEDLEPGVSLAEDITKKKGEYIKQQTTLVNPFTLLRYAKNKLFSSFSGKLTEKDIKKIQKLQAEKKINFKEIRIKKTIPFAPFIFSGVLLTYIVKGNIMLYLITSKDVIFMHLEMILYNIILKFR